MNAYKILGVSENASLEEIKAAYRSKSQRYHPDAGGDTWAFQQLQEAYEEALRRHGVQSGSPAGRDSSSESQNDHGPSAAASSHRENDAGQQSQSNGQPNDDSEHVRPSEESEGKWYFVFDSDKKKRPVHHTRSA